MNSAIRTMIMESDKKRKEAKRNKTKGIWLWEDKPKKEEKKKNLFW